MNFPFYSPKCDASPSLLLTEEERARHEAEARERRRLLDTAIGPAPEAKYPARQSGRTTWQMKKAPQGAIYLCPNEATSEYYRALANFLTRADLRIVSGKSVQPVQFDGVDTAVVIDHATGLTSELFDVLRHANDVRS